MLQPPLRRLPGQGLHVSDAPQRSAVNGMAHDLAVAFGAFALALMANVHDLGSSAGYRPRMLIALVAWPLNGDRTGREWSDYRHQLNHIGNKAGIRQAQIAIKQLNTSAGLSVPR